MDFDARLGKPPGIEAGSPVDGNDLNSAPGQCERGGLP
jgi:hypothetical protein